MMPSFSIQTMFSIHTSHSLISERKISLDSGTFFRFVSSVKLSLFLAFCAQAPLMCLSPLVTWGFWCLAVSPFTFGRSRAMTSAPKSLNMVAAKGAATTVPLSRTRMPLRGPNFFVNIGAGFFSSFSHLFIC